MIVVIMVWEICNGEVTTVMFSYVRLFTVI